MSPGGKKFGEGFGMSLSTPMGHKRYLTMMFDPIGIPVRPIFSRPYLKSLVTFKSVGIDHFRHSYCGNADLRKAE